MTGLNEKEVYQQRIQDTYYVNQVHDVSPRVISKVEEFKEMATVKINTVAVTVEEINPAIAAPDTSFDAYKILVAATVCEGILIGKTDGI